MVNHRVLVLVDDLFWRAKIDHAVKSAGSDAVFVANPGALDDEANVSETGVVFVDLSLRAEPFSAVAAFKKTVAGKAIPVVGFYEHVRKDLKEKAVAAGFDDVLSRALFSERMADIVFKYALPGGTRRRRTRWRMRMRRAGIPPSGIPALLLPEL
jgi:PleD family two-component response regulator